MILLQSSHLELRVMMGCNQLSSGLSGFPARPLALKDTLESQPSEGELYLGEAYVGFWPDASLNPSSDLTRKESDGTFA